MPRVSQEHRDTRRRQILDAATVCFARSGFHGTTMPDIFTEAGLSAGAVYRYFPSKQAIFEALIDSSMEPVVQALRACTEREPALTVPEIIDLIHHEMTTAFDKEVSTSLIVQFWAEAMRVPQVREAQERGGRELHDVLLVLLRHLHPDREIGSDSAWAMVALGLGTFISQAVLKTNSVPTEKLVEELRLLL